MGSTPEIPVDFTGVSVSCCLSKEMSEILEQLETGREEKLHCSAILENLLKQSFHLIVFHSVAMPHTRRSLWAVNTAV